MLQGRAKRSKAAITIEQEASHNPTLQSQSCDPTIFCTAYKYANEKRILIRKPIIRCVFQEAEVLLVLETFTIRFTGYRQRCFQ